VTTNPSDVLAKMRALHPTTPESVYALREQGNEYIREFIARHKRHIAIDRKRVTNARLMRETKQLKKEGNLMGYSVPEVTNG